MSKIELDVQIIVSTLFGDVKPGDKLLVYKNTLIDICPIGADTQGKYHPTSQPDVAKSSKAFFISRDDILGVLKKANKAMTIRQMRQMLGYDLDDRLVGRMLIDRLAAMAKKGEIKRLSAPRVHNGLYALSTEPTGE